MGGKTVKEYGDEYRGEFQIPELAKQPVSFQGMNFKGSTGVNNVTPTDIDGFIQLDYLDFFCWFELKHGDSSVPCGQARSLTRTCDFIQNGGANAVFIIAHHNTPAQEPIVAKDALVWRFYCGGKWHDAKCTLLELINHCIKDIEKKRGIL